MELSQSSEGRAVTTRQPLVLQTSCQHRPPSPVTSACTSSTVSANSSGTSIPAESPTSPPGQTTPFTAVEPSLPLTTTMSLCQRLSIILKDRLGPRSTLLTILLVGTLLLLSILLPKELQHLPLLLLHPVVESGSRPLQLALNTTE